MKQLLQYNRQKAPQVEEVPFPQMKGPGFLVNNRSSLISIGTERQMIELSRMSLAGKARQRPDLVRQVLTKARTEGLKSTYNKVMGRLNAPAPLGYSTAGDISEVHRTVEKFAIGDRVACAGFGYASHAETIFVPTNLAVKIPENVTYDQASFVTLGAIALQGVRTADIRLGENVAVIGLGLLGQLACMLLAAAGCRVIGIDIDQSKFEFARNSGAETTLLSDAAVVQSVMNATGGKGVDSVIITAATQSAGPVTTAGEICREKGSVVVVGAVNMDIPRRDYYNKELSLRLSRSYGPGRYDYNYEEAGQDYPYGYVRWTENRNMESFLQLIDTGKINLDHLITHRFDIEESDKAYDLLTGRNKEQSLGIILSYKPTKLPEKKTLNPAGLQLGRFSGIHRDNIGFVGAGGFAMGVLLPAIKSSDNFKLKSVLSGSGPSAVAAMSRFKFEQAVSSFDELTSDPDIGTIFIANRHGQHAEMVSRSLRAGKATYVEKPLCLNYEELDNVKAAYNSSGAPLMVGFNRRFAPLVAKIKESLHQVNHPLMMHYRINAGYIPDSTWIQDPKSGGGRIIGEICHFVDLLSYICGSDPVKVYAEQASMPDETFRNDDNIQITLKFKNGSVGTINYVASGNKLFAKENIELFGGGVAIRLDDFKTLLVAGHNGVKSFKEKTQDKGHKNMITTWDNCLSGNQQSPIRFNQICLTTAVTFEIINSLAKGEPVWLDR